MVDFSFQVLIASKASNLLEIHLRLKSSTRYILKQLTKFSRDVLSRFHEGIGKTMAWCTIFDWFIFLAQQTNQREYARDNKYDDVFVKAYKQYELYNIKLYKKLINHVEKDFQIYVGWNIMTFQLNVNLVIILKLIF